MNIFNIIAQFDLKGLDPREALLLSREVGEPSEDNCGEYLEIVLAIREFKSKK